MKSYGTSRTASLIGLSALAAASAVMNAFSGLQLLNLSAFVAGFAFGGMQAGTSTAPPPSTQTHTDTYI